MFLIISLIIFILLICAFYSKEDFGIANSTFLNILRENNYLVDRVNERIISNNGSKVIPYNNNFNTYESSSNCSNKLNTAIIMSKNNIPVPKFKYIKKTDDINKFFSNFDLNYPVVIKPLKESNGIGIITDNYNFSTLKLNCNISLTKYEEVMIEEQAYGDAYRVLVFNYKVIDIAGRKKPFAIGNGKTKLSELIKIKNDELKLKNKRYHIEPNLQYIKKQGYNLNDIVKNNDIVYLTNVINRSNGCDIIKVDLSLVPKVNLDMFINSAKVLKILCTGIDFISTDIYTPYYENNSKILELNSLPDISIHIKNEKIKNEFYNNIMNQLDKI